MFVFQTPWQNKYLYVKQITSIFTMIHGFGFEILFDHNGRIYTQMEPYYTARVSIAWVKLVIG